MSDVEIISENDVTEESIQSLFKLAFFETSVVEGGGIKVNLLDGPPVFILIDEEQRVLVYMTSSIFAKGFSAASKIRIANRLNLPRGEFRFAVQDEGKSRHLRIDCSLRFKEGVLASHVIETAR